MSKMFQGMTAMCDVEDSDSMEDAYDMEETWIQQEEPISEWECMCC